MEGATPIEKELVEDKNFYCEFGKDIHYRRRVWFLDLEEYGIWVCRKHLTKFLNRIGIVDIALR